MASVNKVILVGVLGTDPKFRVLGNGRRVVSFPLATSETWTDRATREKKTRTEWHRVVVFNDALGAFAESTLRRGMRIYLEGSNQTRKFLGRDGMHRVTTEVVLGPLRAVLHEFTREEVIPELTELAEEEAQ